MTEPILPPQTNTAVCTATGLDDTAKQSCERVVALQTQELSPETNAQIEAELKSAFSTIVQMTRDEPSQEGVYSSFARQRAYQAYQEILIGLETAQQAGETGTPHDFTLFDPGNLYSNYTEAQRMQRVGCPGMGQMSDLDPASDSSAPTESQMTASNWSGELTGEDSCSVLLELDTEVERLVATTQFVPALGHEAFPDRPLSRWKIGAGVSLNTLKQHRELAGYAESYFMTEASIGYERELHGNKTALFFLGSGPTAQFVYSYVGGDDINLGSHRHQFALRGGWHQAFLSSRRFFVEPDVEIAVAANWLNFGKGYPLSEETSLMAGARLEAGYDFKLGDADLEASLGYFYETTVLGSPDYYNHGPTLNLAYKK